MVILWGALTAVSVLVSRKHGEQDTLGVSRVLRDGLLLAILLVPPTFLLLWNLAPIFGWFGQSQAVVAMAQPYLRALAFGLLPDFFMLVLLQFLAGLGHVRVTMVFTLFWVPVAIIANYGFIFGKLGLPELGIAGIGWGLTTGYWLTTLWLALYILLNKTYRVYLRPLFQPGIPGQLLQLIRIGLPMGLMYALEIGFFFVLALYMGTLSNTYLAANQIVMQFLGLMMAVVFALAQAVTIRMGHLLGEKNTSAATRASRAGVLSAVTFMLLVGMVYALAPDRLIGLDLSLTDSKNAQLINTARQFFVFAAFFQLAEAARIVCFGALRALHDTRFTLLVSVISFWGIALPLGRLLSSIDGLQGTGMWLGMSISALASVVLLWRRLQGQLSTHTV
jgi:MATE family multidrug resistance protein